MNPVATFRVYCLVLCIVAFSAFRANSQCSGISLSGGIGNEIWNSFDTYSDITAGETFNNFIRINYNVPHGTTCGGWKLRVRALGDFTNGALTIAPQFVSIRFNHVIQGGPSAGTMGVSNTTVPLSTSDVTLINSNAPLAAPPDYYTAQNFDMLVAGGNHLLIGSGVYSTTLRFTLYNSSNVAMSTVDLVAKFKVTYSNSCTGVALSYYQSAQNSFTTYAQQMAGTTVADAVNLQYATNGATCRGWTLRVRTTGNFVNGANSVSFNFFSLRFNRVVSGSPSAASIGVSNATVIPLSTSDVVLINPSGDSFNGNTVHRFDLLIQGGNHLLVPNGTYTTNLVFSLYNQANQLVSTTTGTLVFQINSTISSYSLVLQNGANQIDMVFTQPTYSTGISINKPQGLKVTGYSGHQIMVKASTPNLISGSNTIPVDAVSIQAVKYTSTTGAIVCHTRSLSALDQVLISNPMTDHTHQSVEYDLRYFTAPGDSRFSSQSGTFSTSIIFVAVPL